MLPDECVLHDGLAVLLEDLLEVVDVVVLVGRHQVRHRQDLGIILVRLGFLQHNRYLFGKLNIENFPRNMQYINLPTPISESQDRLYI